MFQALFVNDTPKPLLELTTGPDFSASSLVKPWTGLTQAQRQSAENDLHLASTRLATKFYEEMEHLILQAGSSHSSALDTTLMLVASSGAGGSASISDSRSLDTDLKTLVYENYSRFVSATDTIQTLRDNVTQMDDDLVRLRSSVENVTAQGARVTATLSDARQKIGRLTAVSDALTSLQVIFDLPERLRRSLERDAFSSVFRQYCQACTILAQVRRVHRPDAPASDPSKQARQRIVASFQRVQSECDAIMQSLILRLRHRMRQGQLTQQQKAEYVQLMMALCAAPVADDQHPPGPGAKAGAAGAAGASPARVTEQLWKWLLQSEEAAFLKIFADITGRAVDARPDAGAAASRKGADARRGKSRSQSSIDTPAAASPEDSLQQLQSVSQNALISAISAGLNSSDPNALAPGTLLGFVGNSLCEAAGNLRDILAEYFGSVVDDLKVFLAGGSAFTRLHGETLNETVQARARAFWPLIAMEVRRRSQGFADRLIERPPTASATLLKMVEKLAGPLAELGPGHPLLRGVTGPDAGAAPQQQQQQQQQQYLDSLTEATHAALPLALARICSLLSQGTVARCLAIVARSFQPAEAPGGAPVSPTSAGRLVQEDPTAGLMASVLSRELQNEAGSLVQMYIDACGSLLTGRLTEALAAQWPLVLGLPLTDAQQARLQFQSPYGPSACWQRALGGLRLFGLVAELVVAGPDAGAPGPGSGPGPGLGASSSGPGGPGGPGGAGMPRSGSGASLSSLAESAGNAPGGGGAPAATGPGARPFGHRRTGSHSSLHQAARGGFGLTRDRMLSIDRLFSERVDIFEPASDAAGVDPTLGPAGADSAASAFPDRLVPSPGQRPVEFRPRWIVAALAKRLLRAASEVMRFQCSLRPRMPPAGGDLPASGPITVIDPFQQCQVDALFAQSLLLAIRVDQAAVNLITDYLATAHSRCPVAPRPLDDHLIERLVEDSVRAMV
ncbi:hypothetical protein H696_05940 [Fonticula alba]|uniref:Vacuolar protein sorting-associated protein 51 homolog n=1 Tax=Fonticula alba TaxID=691883 RepID=A0A058Z137_FONAL|nr:hypothetical protein H696_05940 [Fonticula alba]KCV67653.1 hypothetical protein H696_05940 [Fonticula alba]|eukprot:XP_009497991.1 hypothetical protein H696_05940 [Fonticula alba]